MAIVNNREYNKEVVTLNRILEGGSFGPVESQVCSKTKLVILNKAFSKYYKQYQPKGSERVLLDRNLNIYDNVMFEEFVQLLQVFREAMCNEAGLRLVQ